MTDIIYTIDAEGKVLGRLASEIATILLGKKTPDVKKNVVASVSVRVVNAGKIKISQKKLHTEKHKTYSGYPGGLKERTLEEVMAKKGARELITHAVEGMLPKNKLHKLRMKKLHITE
ncbi:MAG: 50S ribosomal protein L13 [Patescibacteria group bacterium]